MRGVSVPPEPAPALPLDAVYAMRGEAVVRQLLGEWFLVPVRTTPADFRAIFALNEVGAAVWGEIDGARTLGDLVGAVLERFEVPPETAERDLREFLEQLEGAGLVERRS